MGRRIGSRRKKIREEGRRQAAELRAKHEAYMEQRKVSDARLAEQIEQAKIVAQAQYEKTKALTDKLTEMGFPFHAGHNGHHFFVASYASDPDETLVKLIEALTSKVEA